MGRDMRGRGHGLERHVRRLTQPDLPRACVPPNTSHGQVPAPETTANTKPISVSPTLEPPTKSFARGSGLDFAAWELAAARYRLVIYPREDGTAVDAFYLAGPGVSPPNTLRLAAG